MATATLVSSKNTIITPTHIFFWHGPLSNWHIPAQSFPGSRALALLIARLDADDNTNKIPHPAPTAPSTFALSTHNFPCGEQWMMACKAWFFESDDASGTLAEILSSPSPSVAKALGRGVQNFDDEVWTKVSTPVVVAGSIARAEVDDDLGRLYASSGDRVFVEGSPSDAVWGVRLRFDDPRIRNERNWRGENRLGVCHGIAREAVRQTENEGDEKEKNDGAGVQEGSSQGRVSSTG